MQKPLNTRGWFINAPIDLMFGCGGLVWLLSLITFFCPSLVRGAAAPLSTTMMFVGLVVFGEAHRAATILRLCDEPVLRVRHKFLCTTLPVLLVVLLCGCLLSKFLLVATLKVYLVAAAHHAVGQSYGVTLLYLRRAGLQSSLKARTKLKNAFFILTIASIARNFSSNAITEQFDISIPILVLIPEWIGYSLAALCVVLMCDALTCWVREQQQQQQQQRFGIPIGAICTALSSIAAFTVFQNFGMMQIYVQSFFHGSQYMLVASNHHIVQTKPLVPFTSMTQYWMRTIVLGLFLYFVVPALLCKVGVSAPTALASVFCAIGLHHIATDAFIWRTPHPSRVVTKVSNGGLFASSGGTARTRCRVSE